MSGLGSAMGGKTLETLTAEAAQPGLDAATKNFAENAVTMQSQEAIDAGSKGITDRLGTSFENPTEIADTSSYGDSSFATKPTYYDKLYQQTSNIADTSSYGNSPLATKPDYYDKFYQQTSGLTPPKASFMKNPANYMVQNPSTVAGAVTGIAGLLKQPDPAAPAKPPGGDRYDYAYQPAKYGPDGRVVSPASYGTPTVTHYANGGSIPGFAEGVYIPQSKRIRTDIYGSNAGPIGESGRQMYKNTDKYAGLKAQLDKMSPTMLSKLSQGGTDSIVQAAATTELYDRANTANSSYMDQPTMQAAQGGIMGMAGGGFLSDLINQLTAMGPTEAKSKQYSYDPGGQKYTELAQGGVASLPNEYAAGGKLLQGPGDGMSDSIPAVIKGARPQRAALAQGEFVIPADVVSHLGNGSTDAGAKRLYAMMDKIRHARTGTKKQGRQINPANFMPA